MDVMMEKRRLTVWRNEKSRVVEMEIQRYHSSTQRRAKEELVHSISNFT